MQHKTLQYILKSHFILDPRRLNFIASFILALIKVRTVNLTQIGTALNGLVQPASNAKRAKRFLEFDLLQETINQSSTGGSPCKRTRSATSTKSRGLPAARLLRI